MRLVVEEEELQFREVRLTRRDFFKYIRNSAAKRKQDLFESFDSAEFPGHRAKVVPPARKALAEIFGTLKACDAEQLKHWLFYDLKVAPSCDGCSLCAALCPTGALSSNNFAGRSPRPPAFDAFACTGCGLCAEACPDGSISLYNDADKKTAPTTGRDIAIL